MKYILFWVLTITLILANNAIYSQPKKTETHLTGHIIDEESGEHIPYALVSIKGGKLSVLSDESGHFLLTNIESGNHIVEVSYAGYKSIEQQVDVIANKTTEVHFKLRPTTLEVGTIVVTGSRNETKKEEASSIVNVITPKLFAKTASNNAAEVLNFQSGLRVEYNCSNCGVPQLRINGLEGQYSQILLDSRPILSSLANVYGLEQLPAGMIDRIEVIRGGGSALYGSNAIGGVVNIITKEPLNNFLSLSNNTGIFGKGGTDINTTLNASLISPDAKAGVFLFGVMKDRDSYDHNDDGFSEVPKVNSEVVGMRGYYKLNRRSKITAEYHHMHELRRGGDLFDVPPHQANIAEQLEHNIDGVGVKYDYWSDDYLNKLSIYSSMQNINRNSYFGTNQNPNAYGKTHDLTVVGGAQYTHSFKKLLFMPSQLSIGTEYSQNRLKDNMIGYNRIIDQNVKCFGSYLQNEWKNEKWGILIGARIDKHNMIKNVIVSPRVNLRYAPFKDVALRLSYSSGYRAPMAYDEDLHVAAVGGEVAIITLDPNLKPEYSKSVSGSVDWYKNIGNVEVNILVEGFYTNLNDVFTLVEKGYDDKNNLILERQNAPGADVTGINLELKLGITRKIILSGGFTYQKSFYKEPLKWSDNNSVKPEKRMFRSPDTYGYITLNYQPISRLSLSTNVNYTGSMLVQHYAGYIEEDTTTVTQSFWNMGVKAAYNFSLSPKINMELNCGVKNLLNSFQKDLDVGVDKDAGYIYGPTFPRTIFVGAAISF